MKGPVTEDLSAQVLARITRRGYARQSELIEEFGEKSEKEGRVSDRTVRNHLYRLGRVNRLVRVESQGHVLWALPERVIHARERLAQLGVRHADDMRPLVLEALAQLPRVNHWGAHHLPPGSAPGHWPRPEHLYQPTRRLLVEDSARFEDLLFHLRELSGPTFRQPAWQRFLETAAQLNDSCRALWTALEHRLSRHFAPLPDPRKPRAAFSQECVARLYQVLIAKNGPSGDPIRLFLGGDKPWIESRPDGWSYGAGGDRLVRLPLSAATDAKAAARAAEAGLRHALTEATRGPPSGLAQRVREGRTVAETAGGRLRGALNRLVQMVVWPGPCEFSSRWEEALQIVEPPKDADASTPRRQGLAARRRTT